jgi:hypothetical protein
MNIWNWKDYDYPNLSFTQVPPRAWVNDFENADCVLIDTQIRRQDMSLSNIFSKLKQFFNLA